MLVNVGAVGGCGCGWGMRAGRTSGSWGGGTVGEGVEVGEEGAGETQNTRGMVEAVESIGVSQDVVVDQPKVETPSRFPAPPLVPPNVHTPHKLIVEDAAMDEIAALRPPPIRRQTGGPRRRKSPSDQ